MNELDVYSFVHNFNGGVMKSLKAFEELAINTIYITNVFNTVFLDSKNDNPNWINDSTGTDFISQLDV